MFFFKSARIFLTSGCILMRGLRQCEAQKDRIYMRSVGFILLFASVRKFSCGTELVALGCSKLWRK